MIKSSYASRRDLGSALAACLSGVRGALLIPEVLRLRRMSATLAGMPESSEVDACAGMGADGPGVAELRTGVLGMRGGVGTTNI